MSLDAERGRGNPEHVLLLDPFEEPFRYLVVELCHGTKVIECFGRQVGARLVSFYKGYHTRMTESPELVCGREPWELLSLKAPLRGLVATSVRPPRPRPSGQLPS